MANLNRPPVDPTLSVWGSLERDVGSFGVYYKEEPSVSPMPDALLKCTIYIPLAKTIYYPCNIRMGFPAGTDPERQDLFKVQFTSNMEIAYNLQNAFGLVREEEGPMIYKSMMLGWDQIRHIVIRSPLEVEIGLRFAGSHGEPNFESKLVIMTHNQCEVEHYMQHYLIDNFAVPFRLPGDGLMGEMLFGTYFEECEELKYWYRFGREPIPEIWQAYKCAIFRVAHTLVDNEITGRSPRNYPWLEYCFNDTLQLYLQAPDCSVHCWDDPRQLVAEETVAYQAPLARRCVPPVQQEQCPNEPMVFRRECQVYLSQQARWHSITYIRFEANPQGALMKFYNKQPNCRAVKLFECRKGHLYYWKEVCIVDADHYALVLYCHFRYVYIRTVNMAHHLELRTLLINTFGAYYPTVGDEDNAADTLMSELNTVSLVAYGRLWANPGGGAADQLFYRTVESKRAEATIVKKLVSHNMQLMACRMMDRYAFKLARALLRGEWNRTNADANVAPNEPRRILRQLALYKSLLPDMTKWFHHATRCVCTSCMQKVNRLWHHNASKGGRFLEKAYRDAKGLFYFYKQKQVLDCRIKHAHFDEPDY